MLLPNYPKKIICLTEETTEVLYAIGASDLIIGISEYTVRPPEAPKEKPVVSRYLDAKTDKIFEMKPDIVLAWSDLQADISKELIKMGIEVITFNHRSISGILSMILKLGGIVGKNSEAKKYADSLAKRIDAIEAKSKKINNKPKVYFEEWFDPLISPICWVSELIEIAGGIEIFKENRDSQGAKGRIIENTDEVVNRNPDIIMASWCGKKFHKPKLIRRKNWDKINAVIHDEIYEIPSDIILQPGPAALTDGVDMLADIISKWSFKN